MELGKSLYDEAYSAEGMELGRPLYDEAALREKLEEIYRLPVRCHICGRFTKRGLLSQIMHHNIHEPFTEYGVLGYKDIKGFANKFLTDK